MAAAARLTAASWGGAINIWKVAMASSTAAQLFWNACNGETRDEIELNEDWMCCALASARSVEPMAERTAAVVASCVAPEQSRL